MRKSNLNKVFVVMGVIGAVALFSGCVRRSPMLDLLSTENLDTGSISISVAEPSVHDVNVAVIATAQTESAKMVAGILETGIRGTLSDQGYRQTFDQADFVVNMDISASRYDSFGEFHIYDASADTEVFGAPQMNSIGSKKFSARSERKLGRDAALSDTAAKLTTTIKDWLIKILTPERLRAVTSHVTALLPERFQMTPQEYAVMMAGTIAELPGVFACRVIDIVERTVTFQVNYNHDSFPEGLDNYLAAVKQPEVALLNRTIVSITFPKKYRMSQGEYVRLFIETVTGQNGVEECRALDRDPANRITRLEVVFNPVLFPEGLYYRLTGLEKLDLIED